MNSKELSLLVKLLTKFQEEHQFQCIPHDILVVETQLQIQLIKESDTKLKLKTSNPAKVKQKGRKKYRDSKRNQINLSQWV